jgi:hypothetical protein
VAWRNVYPEASVHHLTRINSDHCPVLLCLDTPPSLPLVYPFIFQPVWLSHPLFPGLVQEVWESNASLEPNVYEFTKAVKIWNKEIFGNIPRKKRRIEACLKGIHTSLAIAPNDFLVKLEKEIRLELLAVLQ